jgi:hypothetical protein
MVKKVQKRCLKCEKVILERRKNAIFCSDVCRVRHNSLMQYRKNKDSPIYKKQAKERLDRWRKKNRKKFNKLCNDNMKKKKVNK